MPDPSSLFPRDFSKDYPHAVRGEGCWVFTDDGRKYLDAAGQAAVVTIGHGVSAVGRAMAEGIPGRPWFQHLLYAARFTYAHLELPGLTEAAEKHDWETAKQQLSLLEAAVARNAQLLREARAELEDTR